MAALNKRTGAVNGINCVTNHILKESYDGDRFALKQDQTSLQAHFDRFIAAHDELIFDAKTGELDTHFELWDQMELIYNDAMAKLNRLLAAASVPLCTTAVDHSHLETIGGSGSVISSSMHLKLEILSIPKFDGTLRNWLVFKDTLVHSQDFPEAYKLGKLRESVQGDAVSSVGGMYSGGYKEVWKALKDRYHNPRQLAEIHVARFIGLAPITNESTSTLLSVVDTVRESLRALLVTKLPVDQWDALAVPIVVSKLPNRTQQEWGMSRSSNDIPTLEELLKFLEKRAHSLTADLLKWSSASTTGARVVANRNPALAGNSLRLVKTNLGTIAPGNCEFCNTLGHRISQCPDLTSLPVAEWFSKLKGSNLCFNYLKPGHSTKACSSTNCRTCNGRHHTLLCQNPKVATEVPVVGTSSKAGTREVASTLLPRVYQ